MSVRSGFCQLGEVVGNADQRRLDPGVNARVLQSPPDSKQHARWTKWRAELASLGPIGRRHVGLVATALPGANVGRQRE